MSKNLNRFFISLLFVIILILCGCEGLQPLGPCLCKCSEKKLIAGYSVLNKQIDYSVIGCGSKKSILVIGGIHGNEPKSTVLAEKIKVYLSTNSFLTIKRTVVIIPAANPDGLAAGTRYNANGVDINRNFPAANRVNNKKNGYAGLTEPESVIIKELIEKHKIDMIISIHEPYGCIDWDGPAEELAHKMAGHCKLPVKKLGAMPGSLGSYAGVTLGIPVITYELPEAVGQMNDDTIWHLYAEPIIAAIENGY